LETAVNSNSKKTALVTGASSGIGHATAEALARAGFTVFGTSRKPSWRRGLKRHRGDRVEKSARSQLKRILPFGWSVDETTPFIPGVGNVDMLIRTGRHRFVVEVKSWEDVSDERNVAAAAQARNLLRALAEREGRNKWHAVVWLPQGKKTRTRKDRELILVRGPRYLLRVLHLVLFGFF
jgi:NAD(P)-dependent dehydrogenase (short-subunit alcohol dehydrogenase family)